MVNKSMWLRKKLYFKIHFLLGTNSSTFETQKAVPQASIDAINNNKQDPVKIPKPIGNKRTSKIEIQKIENVNIEINELIQKSNSEPIKTGDTKIKMASPVPVNRSPVKVVEQNLELPEIEATPTIMPVLEESDILIQEVNMYDHPCSSMSMPVNFQPKTIKKVSDESKNDEIINNVSEEEDEGELMDIEDEAWLHDINVMIGKHRIEEIDQSLKKIPTTVTGNRIQTENVELKLIINHLLSKLKAKSVLETVDEPSTSFYNNIKGNKTFFQ